MNFLEEFSTIDLILNSQAKTRGVDAFALALIKAEKQIRRLVTHLVYQAPAFEANDIRSLRRSLESNCKVYFEGLQRGFDALYEKSARELVGAEYERLRRRLREAATYRGKIFHGQLTAKHLPRKDLQGIVCDIRLWCLTLAENCSNEFGYDGFSSSFHKSKVPDLHARLRTRLGSVKEYEDFIKEHMERRKT